MKRLLDINTWIALSLETHPQHRPARLWYDQTPLLRGELVFCRQTKNVRAQTYRIQNWRGHVFAIGENPARQF